MVDCGVMIESEGTGAWRWVCFCRTTHAQRPIWAKTSVNHERNAAAQIGSAEVLGWPARYAVERSRSITVRAQKRIAPPLASKSSTRTPSPARPRWRTSAIHIPVPSGKPSSIEIDCGLRKRRRRTQSASWMREVDIGLRGIVEHAMIAEIHDSVPPGLIDNRVIRVFSHERRCTVANS